MKRIIIEKFKVSPEEYVKLFKNDDFEVVVPLTFEASKKYGANSKWCTISKCDDTMFNKHNSMGSLAYLIIKNPEIVEKIGTTKYGLYFNKPSENYLGGKYPAPTGIMMYDDKNNVVNQSYVENEFDKIDKLSDYYKIIKSFSEFTENKFSDKTISESQENFLNERESEILKSLIKKYIPNNSSFETSIVQPYNDGESDDIFIEYSLDYDNTRFFKADVQEDDEPIKYEGTVYLLIHKLLQGNREENMWEDVEYYDLPDYVFSEIFDDSIYNKITPITKSFNLDVDIDYNFLKQN